MIRGIRGWLALAVLATALTLTAPTIAGAATPVSPSAGQVVTTSTPTATVALDAAVQPDGTAAESSPLMSVYGPSPNGQSTVLAFCEGTNNGDGTWYCSDPTQRFASSLVSYYWTFTYSLHTCVSIGGAPTYLLPSCVWLTSSGVGGTFTVSVAAAGATTTQPMAMTPAIAAPADVTTPKVKAIPTIATVGQVAHLLFTASDSSGASSLFFVVIGHGRTGWKRTLVNATVKSGVRYSVPWRPASAGLYAFCLAAVDAAGNKSATSCAPVIVG
jgi:hypothetical protein